MLMSEIKGNTPAHFILRRGILPLKLLLLNQSRASKSISGGVEVFFLLKVV